MENIMVELMKLQNWQTGIPLACFGATCLFFISFSGSSYKEVSNSLVGALVSIIIVYEMVWILIGMQLNFDTRWRIDRDIWPTVVILLLSLFIAIGVGIVMADESSELLGGIIAGVITYVLSCIFFGVICVIVLANLSSIYLL